MHYEFPTITHISQVLPLIKDKPEFIVSEKDGDYTVINYVVQTADTFPPVRTADDAILRELRGMIFKTSTGEILHRRLHKFFNVNEKEETQVGGIDFTKPHVILEKLDGSMITPVFTANGIRWGTKMGVTAVALPVEEFVSVREEYILLAQACANLNATPIFEWTSRKQTIVIDYPEDQLTLIAIRDNVTGKYYTYEKLKQVIADFRDIPLVKAYAGTAANMQALIDQTSPMVGCEGFVVRFDDGHMVKVKAEDYVRKHKAKDMIGREKNVIDLIVNEKIDDVKAFLDHSDLQRLQNFEEKFWHGVMTTVNKLVALRKDGDQFTIDRKTYAVEFVQKQEPKYHKFLYSMFTAYQSTEVLEMVKTVIAQSCATQVRVDEARWLFNCEWSAVQIDE